MNRGGNRKANNALWRIALNRLQTDPRTQQYSARRKGQGKTPRHILRSLKRYISREIYRTLNDPHLAETTDGLRPKRLALGISKQVAADHFHLALTTISRTERGIRANYEFVDHYRNWLEHQHIKNIA